MELNLDGFLDLSGKPMLFIDHTCDFIPIWAVSGLPGMLSHGRAIHLCKSVPLVLRYLFTIKSASLPYAHLVTILAGESVDDTATFTRGGQDPLGKPGSSSGSCWT